MLWRGEKMCPETSVPFCLSFSLSFFLFFSSLVLSFINSIPHCTIYLYNIYIIYITFSPSTAPVSPSQALSLSLLFCLPVTYTSYQQPPAAGCLWSPDCCDWGWRCVTRVSKQSWPSWILSHTIWMAFPPERRAGSWLAVHWANESRPLTGPGGYDNRGCWVFHRF